MADLPPWTHRRKVIYTSVVLSVLMVLAGILATFTNFGVATQLIVSGSALLTVTVSAYVGGAVIDDYVHRATYQELDDDTE